MKNTILFALLVLASCVGPQTLRAPVAVDGRHVYVAYDRGSGNAGSGFEGSLISWDDDWVVVRRDDGVVYHVETSRVYFVREGEASR